MSEPIDESAYADVEDAPEHLDDEVTDPSTIQPDADTGGGNGSVGVERCS